MTEIRIRYPSGRMTVYLENFFPAKQGDVKKLLKTINMDRSAAMQIEFIKKWIEKEIRLCDSNSGNRKGRLEKNLVVISS